MHMTNGLQSQQPGLIWCTSSVQEHLQLMLDDPDGSLGWILLLHVSLTPLISNNIPPHPVVPPLGLLHLGLISPDTHWCPIVPDKSMQCIGTYRLSLHTKDIHESCLVPNKHLGTGAPPLYWMTRLYIANDIYCDVDVLCNQPREVTE